ncbi:MAG: tetratricopeptide repeat protein [Aridibacter sp.]
MNLFFKFRKSSVYFLTALLLFAFAVQSLNAQDEEEFSQDEFSQDKTAQNDPIKLFNKAQDAQAKGDFQTAIKFYQDAIKSQPKFPEAEYQIGNAFESLNKTDDAEKAFRQALEMRPDWTLAMSALGSLLVKKGNFAEAETLLLKAIKLNEMNFPAFDALTQLRLQTNASETELKDLLLKIQNLTSKANPPASAWASRGALERKLGLKDAAKVSINNALSIDPNNYFALTEKIELSLLEGDFDAAIANSKNFLQIAPNLEIAKILLAKSFALSGNSKDALDILAKIENPSKDAVSLKTSIESISNENVESLEKLLADDKNNVSVLSKLCRLLRTENPQKALEYCKTASSLEPSNINYAIGFGAALVQLKRYSDAISLFRNLLNVSPENYTIHANLATALFQMQDFENAKIEYRWITKNQPDLAIAYYFLAISHDRLEEYIDAMANYQQFLRLADKDEQKLEIEKVDLRLPILQKQINNGKGKKGR